MFSIKEKQHIAAELEKIILDLNHPEMPKDKPVFHLRIDGKESWSWAEIEPNWTFGSEGPKSANPWNEILGEVL